MALKPDRKYNDGTDIHYFMSETAERGIIVIHDDTTSGVGAAMDDADAAVKVPTDASGTPAGLLLNDVVNLDLTRQRLNPHQDEVQLGGKVTVLTHGWVVTDKIVSGDAPKAGDPAYFAASGELSTTDTSDQVGKWLSAKDSDGYAKVEINLPL
jgi:hypothetical protein